MHEADISMEKNIDIVYYQMTLERVLAVILAKYWIDSRSY